MNILNKVTWKALRENRVRTMVTVIGVILSAAMFMAVVTLGISFWDYLHRATVAVTGDWFISFEDVSSEQKALLTREESVIRVAELEKLGYLDAGEDVPASERYYRISAADGAFFASMPVNLLSGRTPESSGEILLPENLYRWLQEQGIPAEPGDKVTLPVGDTVESAEKTVTYTISGVFENAYYNNWECLTALTFADGNQSQALSNRLYVKTDPASAVETLRDKGYGERCELNTDLLQCYGVSGYRSFFSVLTGICVVLVIIILAGSVSLIYNAFSISVAERAKQFGLLRSIGATRRQLRRSVFFEAGVISLMGIPVGLLCGYGGIAVVLRLLQSNVDDLFAGGRMDNGIVIRAVAPPAAFAIAAVIAVLTVLLSVWIPALRSTRVSPVEAIRQTQDYKVPARAVKVGKPTYWLFGLPGLLSRKYYRVSRGKYRATVISLAISVVLFLPAATLAANLRAEANHYGNIHNFDLECQYDGEDWETVFAKIRQQPGVSDSAYFLSDLLLPVELSPEDYSKEMQDVASRSLMLLGGWEYPCVYYMEDAALERYFMEQGIDPAPYLNAGDPAALVCKAYFSAFISDPATGREGMERFHIPLLSDSVKSLTVQPEAFPEELYPAGPGMNVTRYSYTVMDEEVGWIIYCHAYETVNGSMQTVFSQAYRMEIRELGDGRVTRTFYLYSGDPEEETEAVCEQTVALLTYRLGATAPVPPMGISEDTNLRMVLPYSAKPEELDQTPVLVLTTSDRASVKAYLEENGIDYIDFAREEERMRGIMLLINVFSYGFLTLISLICVANVFNTISTNIALRRRDFGMLRSVGMKRSQMYRMMAYECLLYGSRALLWGLPLGVAFCYVSHQYTSSRTAFAIPWGYMAIAAGCVFLVVAVSMAYATHKLRKDSPIEAIRVENF